MKKLFLYTAGIIYLFWSGFMIFSEIYRNKDYRYDIITTEETAPDNAAEASSVNHDYYVHNIGDYIGLVLNLKLESLNVPLYTVGIKDGSVVVFDENNELYEYTGVDAALIKTLNYDLYQKIEEGLGFDSEEALYIFLESVSS